MPIHFRAICSCSAASGPNARHSAYSLRFARIAYPWHPLFGRSLQISPFRRGKDLKCIYTEERPDLCRELPNWMFDEAYCGGMTLGPPEIGIEGLHDLGKLLASLRKTRKRPAPSPFPKPREKRGAERKNSKSSATWYLELKSPAIVPPLGSNIPGLVEAVADLLLAAIGGQPEVASIETGGVHEQQDHA